jgi:glycosyltransferase involved in cell wall biosynthesis
MKTEVSIGVCMRNCQALVKDAIDSIVNQNFPHEMMELIFVDDGSEDDTLSIVQEYTSKINISTKIFHTSWKGLGHARNIVVANARSRYVLWVDGDMVLSKDYVKKQVEFMEQHPQVGIAKGRQALKPGANLLATLEAYARAAGRMIDYQAPKSRSMALGTGGAIYRTETFGRVGKFDENLRNYGEDLDFEIRARAVGYLLSTIDAEFSDYERHRLTWRNLWSKYWLRGYHSHHFLHKRKSLLKHHKTFPPAAFLSGLLHARKLFKLTGQKFVFLLPPVYSFKMTAWYFGFITSHFDSYEPR